MHYYCLDPKKFVAYDPLAGLCPFCRHPKGEDTHMQINNDGALPRFICRFPALLPYPRPLIVLTGQGTH